ncbi:UNKNOWN [Stylonychia lemnae]|uniref:Uncharacterized protein n=1 Tax=Stylonychia lemnae TaxID=5949 RepID=A0A078BB79_STYLE|nr:UNKNOWN [Stylonychia lemnae]|eukprot:CDW91815.1 UNKNOWN [Stylonychia lemnae]
MSGALANKFSKRDNKVQVVQNYKTGELLSQIDKALVNFDKMQDAKSVQASFINPYIGNKLMKSGVSSVVRGVPSDNPLSNESRFVNRVPNKPVLNLQPNFNQSINQNSNNFMQTRGSLQGYKNYTYQPQMVKPKLMIQDFYRQNQTNISSIQEQLMPRTLASNQSYINVYEKQRSQGQSMIQPQPYIQSFQNTFNPQRAPVNTYHHQIRDTQSQRDNARILDDISTGRFSMNTHYQHQNQVQQPINNLGQAINILMN